MLGFFGVEPQVLDAGVPWFYNRLTFSLETSVDHLTCAIEPAEGHIEVAWRHRTLVVTSEAGISYLLAAQEGNSVQLRLWLEPHVRVFVGAI